MGRTSWAKNVSFWEGRFIIHPCWELEILATQLGWLRSRHLGLGDVAIPKVSRDAFQQKQQGTPFDHQEMFRYLKCIATAFGGWVLPFCLT